ncbi:ATP-binding protein [Candidatus Nitronereus thalassa]|uniref:histidine kinase n=1 Tax=Candidatus Nitronereus thalassa TaxID=3020898 RepID=A0ABU3K9J7_9BACT|nr:ATP-binding protein [Candidatus Nitronereus thalassa]MDT7043037.1 ATP-binding protein [Candidatus Nitronereus thalassa]
MDPFQYKQQAAHRRQGLKKKIILSILIVGILPLVIGQIMSFYKGREEILEVNGDNFQALAIETARGLDLTLMEEVAQAERIAAEPEMIRELEARRDALSTLDPEQLIQLSAQAHEAWRHQTPSLVEEITQGPLALILHQYYLRTFQSSGRATAALPRSSTRALFVTDIAGRLVASLNTNVEFLHADQPWWKGAFHSGAGKPYLGAVSFHKDLGTHTIALSIPILDSIRYQAVGILHRVYDVTEFFAPTIESIQFGETGHVMLVDSQGTVIYCPVLETGSRLSLTELPSSMVADQSGWTQTAGDGHDGHTTSIIGFAALQGTNRITTSSTQTSWHTFVWKHPDELFAPIQHLQIWNGIFGLIAISLLIALGAMAAERIVNPIRRLQDAARLIGKGELVEPLNIQTGDEIQELAEEVNRMNQQLVSAMGGLRSEVESKTQEMLDLQESTSKILHNVPTPVILLDSQERVTYLNQAGREALGWNMDTLESLKLFDLLPVKEPIQQKLREELNAQSTGTEEAQNHHMANGHKEKFALKDPLSADLDLESELPKNMLEINDRMFWYDWFFIKARFPEKGAIGLVLRDATEESLVQEQLAYREKISSLGILSSGIGHELNNPLVGVIGLGEAIQEEENLTQAKTLAKEIVQHGQRMANVIRNISGQVRGQAQGQVRDVLVVDEIGKAWELVKESLNPSSITVNTAYQCNSAIRAQPEEIRQIFVNVLTNSVQAMEGKGSLSLSTHCSDELITISIQDSGPGIPKAHVSKIFDPFFTTKRQGEGSGLGLTIARRIISRYHGSIQMTSPEHQGTVCLISFPTQGKVKREEGDHEKMAQS